MTPNQAPDPLGLPFHVYARHSELYSSANPEELWNGLQSAPIIEAIQALAWINNRLSADRSAEVHSQLMVLPSSRDVLECFG